MVLFDYYTLKIIWWVFVGVLLIGFAVTDGFDLGVGILLFVVGRTDDERRVMLNAIGPTWEGNQVWFITAGGALFAAWPVVYATAFSGFYWAMLLVLFALFFRPVGFEYRGKVSDPRWRKAWDMGMVVGGFVPALVFGVAFGNLFQGVPFTLDPFMRSFYHGSFWGLLNPFGILAGLVSVTMLVVHGALFLQLKTEGKLRQRARRAAMRTGIAFIAVFGLAGIWQAVWIHGYRILSMPDPGTSFTPLEKTVQTAAGAWTANFSTHPWMIAAPVIAFAGVLLAILFSRADRPGIGFVASGAGIAGVILTAGFALFPFIMPSSMQPNASLTAFDVVSSLHTLNLMFFAVVLFLPIVVIYTSWVYRVMRGPVTEKTIEENPHSTY